MNEPKRTARVQFSTTVIAPAGLPDFVYVPSSIGHSQIGYTALIDIEGDDPGNLKLIAKVSYHWPDATITVAEIGTETFHNDDLRLTKHIRGVYRLNEDAQREPGTLRRFWLAARGVRRVRIEQPSDFHINTQEGPHAAKLYAR